MCGHSLEVNVTSSLDFYLSVAQVQLLQQLLRENTVGMDAPEKSAEVRYCNQLQSLYSACLSTSSVTQTHTHMALRSLYTHQILAL